MKNRRLLLPLAVAVGLIPAGNASAAQVGSGFKLGVTAGEVTQNSALLWAKTARSGQVRLELSRDRRFSKVTKRKVAVARAKDDNTVQVKVVGLKPDTDYYYRFRAGGKTKSKVGHFLTAPSRQSSRAVKFAISGDTDAQPAPGKKKPYYNNFEIYRLMAQEGNDFNINLGDTIYSDSEVPGIKKSQAALTVRQKWAKYRQNIALANLQKVRGSTGFYSHWDDHEFFNDFSIPDQGRKLYEAGVKAFRDYSPVTYTDELGIYRKFRWGKNAELFFLDQRSFRSGLAEKACTAPGAKRPDLGPTAPEAARKLFSAAAPELKVPASQQCLDTINSPERTMLGPVQYNRFTKDILASTATFKIVVSETPIQQFYALPYDRWEGYAYERGKLIEFLKANVKNVVFLSTDVHASYVNDVRIQTLEAGGPVNSGILEVVTGPVATLTFSEEIALFSGLKSAGELVTNLFFARKPPNGPGMVCAASDAYSYAQVNVTKSALKISLKDIEGKKVREQAGKRCGPYTVKAVATGP